MLSKLLICDKKKIPHQALADISQVLLFVSIGKYRNHSVHLKLKLMMKLVFWFRTCSRHSDCWDEWERQPMSWQSTKETTEIHTCFPKKEVQWWWHMETRCPSRVWRQKQNWVEDVQKTLQSINIEICPDWPMEVITPLWASGPR